MIRKSAMLLAAILVGVSAFVFSGRPDAPASVSAARKQTTEASDEKIFRHLFRRVASLRARADEIERRGGDARSLRGLYQRRANLNDQQAGILDQIALQYAAEVSAIDAQANQIIRAYRARYPNGEVPRGQLPAPPPIELRQLTEARNQLVRRKRDELRAALGENEFNRFRESVKSKIKPNAN